VPKYRNITDETLHVDTDRGLVAVEPDALLVVSAAFAATRYWQTGETGEDALWALVEDAPAKKSTEK
jgi:hypothetical protein